MSKYSYFLLLIPLAIVIALMVVGTLYDLQIAIDIYNRESLFAIIFDYVGEMPLYGLFPFCLAICFVYYRQYTSTKYIVLSFLSVVFCVLSIYLFMQRFFTFLPASVNLGITLVLSFVLMYTFHFFKRDTLEKLYKFALIAITVLIIALLLNQAIKYLWGRYRFHNLYVANNLERFTPWYLPLGINGNKSFPSGHASSATNLFLLVTLCSIFKSKQWVKVLITILVSLFVVAVCLSRMVYGAHYLTDVTMGFAISFTVYFVVQYLYFKHFEKKEKIAST